MNGDGDAENPHMGKSDISEGWSFLKEDKHGVLPSLEGLTAPKISIEVKFLGNNGVVY